jgi:hypothetical protein
MSTGRLSRIRRCTDSPPRPPATPPTPPRPVPAPARERPGSPTHPGPRIPASAAPGSPIHPDPPGPASAAPGSPVRPGPPSPTSRARGRAAGSRSAVWPTQSPRAAASRPLSRGTSCTDIRNVPTQLSSCQTLSTTRSRSGCQVTRNPAPRSSRNISRRADSADAFSTGLAWSLQTRDSRAPPASPPRARSEGFPHFRRTRPLRGRRRLGSRHAELPRRSRRAGATR